jgi:hypothetical protein
MTTDVDAPDVGAFMDTMKQDPKMPLFHNNTDVNVLEIGREHGNPEQFFAELGTLFVEMKDALAESGMWDYKGMTAEAMYFAGISIDKSYGGVHIKLPYKAIYINPLYNQWNEKTLFGTRGVIINTMMHEIAHEANMGHNAQHNAAQVKIERYLEDKGLMDYFRDSILKTLGRHEAVFNAMREAYDKSSARNIGKSFKDYEENSESRSDGRDSGDPGESGGLVQIGAEPQTGRPAQEPVDEGGVRREPATPIGTRNAISDKVDVILDTSIAARRDTKKLGQLREAFLGDLNDRVAIMKEAIQEAVNDGVFEGYEVGDRLQGKTGTLTITGRTLRKYKGKDDNFVNRSLEAAGATPTVIEKDGEQFIPMLRYSKPDGTDSTLYLDAIKARGMKVFKGPKPALSVAQQATPGITIDQAKSSVEKALGHKLAARVEFYETVDSVPDSVVGSARQLLNEAGVVEGFVLGRKAYLITSNLESTERAAWVAWHEMWHRGAKIRYGAQFNRVLRKARTNNIVRRLSDKIKEQREDMSDVQATNEALAELNAAMRTGNYDRITEQYGIKIPASMKSGWRAVVQSWIDMIKRLLRIISDVQMSDTQISNLVRGIPLNTEGEIGSFLYSVQFERPEVEERWKAAGEGLTPPTLRERVAAHITDIQEGFTRHFINLPDTAQFAEVTEQLRKIEAAPEASRDTTIRLMKLITQRMTADDLDLFTRKVVLDDLQYEITQDHDLPMDLTPTEVAETLDRINEVLVNRPDIMEAVEARRIMVRSIANKMVEAGVLTESEIHNPYYYRHQVLDYMHAKSRYGMQRGSVRTPKRASRKGSIKDINVNYLEVEFEWLNKALNDIEVAKVLEWIKNSIHNVREEAIAAGRASNERNFQRILDSDLETNGYEVYSADGERVLRVTSPLNEQNKAFTRKIAMGIEDVRKALEEGLEAPQQYADVAMELLEGEGGRNPRFFQFIAWVADNGEAGSGGAKMIFSAVNKRKAWKRELLGEAYVNTRNMEELIKKEFAPEGYVTWQPDKGRLLYTAQSLPQHVVDKMVIKMSEEGENLSALDAEEMMGQVKSLLAVGGEKYQMIIPEELAATLDSLHDEHMSGVISQAATQALTLWKRWQLISPWRIIKYNLNNLSGDLDAVIALGPKILKKFPKATAELTAVMFGGAQPSASYNAAVRRGVFSSGLSMQEIAQIDEMAEFRNILERKDINLTTAEGIRELFKRIKNMPISTFRAMQKITWWRENMMRYAAYLHFEELLQSGHELGPMEYGASRPEILQELTNEKDKAAMMARKTVGDYGDISHYGSHMRRNVYPFWSWVEVNAKRYWRLGVNAMEHNIFAGLAQGTLSATVIGAKGTAWLTMRTLAMYTFVQLWNNILFHDEEEELSTDQRARLHINAGRTADGKVRTIRFQGALSDFLDWIGFGDVSDTIMEIEKGRATYKDVLEAAGTAPINKFVGGVTPYIKVPIELLRGESWWPDVFHPRRIRDRYRYVAQIWALEHEYDLLTGKASPGYAESLGQLVWRETDPGQASYNQIRSAAYEWRERTTGKKGSSSFTTPRSEALYQLRLAQKYGDKEAEARAREEVVKQSANRSDARKAIAGYAKKSAPLAMLSAPERRKFKRTLSKAEKLKLRQAERWHKDTFR